MEGFDKLNPPYLNSIPEVISHTLAEKDQFLVLTTDGLLDYFNNEEIGTFIEKHHLKSDKLSEMLITEALTRAAKRVHKTIDDIKLMNAQQRRDIHDDMAVICINLKRWFI